MTLHRKNGFGPTSMAEIRQSRAASAIDNGISI
jgi:hypothetical protein